jgi:hypothetical protein
LEVEVYLFLHSTMDRGEWPASHPSRFVLRKNPGICCIGLNWQITLEGLQEAISCMGIRNLNLRSSQVRKMGKISLKTGFSLFKSFHRPNNRLKYFYCLPLFKSAAIKKLFFGTKIWEGNLPLLHSPHDVCDPLFGLQSRSEYF